MKTVMMVPVVFIIMSAAWYVISMTTQSNVFGGIISNILFCMVLTIYIYRIDKNDSSIFPKYIIGCIFTIAGAVASAFIGAIISSSHQIFGNILMHSLSLGYYPPGPDVPFMPGVVLWSLSIIALAAVSVGIAFALRRYVRSERI